MKGSTVLLSLAAGGMFFMLVGPWINTSNPGRAAAQAATAEITDSVLIRRQTQDAQERLAQRKLQECMEDPRCANYDVESRSWVWKEDPPSAPTPAE